MSRPVVSVLVPAYRSEATLPLFLDSLRAQVWRDFEVIVVDSSPEDLVSAVVAGYPEVRLRRSPRRLLPHQARNEAALLARGEILVFTDPDCRAAPDWLERLVSWQQRGYAVVGGAVEHLPGWWNTAVHHAKYAWWLSGGSAGERPEIPSANASFSRSAWERVGPFRGDRFAGDSEISWRVRDAGIPIWFDPDAVVTHLDHVRPPAFFRERFARGKDFGFVRGPARGWGRWQYAARLLTAPAGPLLMTARAGRYARAAHRTAAWTMTLPLQAAANSLWCAGEFATHARLLFSNGRFAAGANSHR